jgi:hypothetical protein
MAKTGETTAEWPRPPGGWRATERIPVMRKWLPLVAVCLGTFMLLIDFTCCS